MTIKHKGTKLIETERLVLRKAKLSDARYMFETYFQDKEVTKYVLWYPHKSIEESKEFISSWVNSYDDETKYRWVITRKDGEDKDKAIGTIDVVVFSEKFKMAEIGYCLSSKHWNKGYMSEALRSVIKYIFEIGVHRIQAKHDVRNIASGRVMQKAGMSKEATLHDAIIGKDDKFYDVVMYYILNK